MSLKSRTPESSIDMIKAKAKRCLSKSRHLLVDACTAASDTSGRRHYTTVGYTNLKAPWHLIRCQCGNHGYSVNFHDLRLLLTFALLDMRQPRFKLSLATGRGGRFLNPSHDHPHIHEDGFYHTTTLLNGSRIQRCLDSESALGLGNNTLSICHTEIQSLVSTSAGEFENDFLPEKY